MKSKPIRISLLFSVLCILSCYPVYDGPLDLEEQQSVWQYLNVFTIYQEKLPPECGDRAPKELFKMIGDSLYGNTYTGYVNYSGGAAGDAGSTHDNGDMMAEVTDSTMYLRISEFSDISMDKFNNWRFTLESYKNIIIDLRNNPGGSLQATDSIAGEFVPTGAEYISTRRRVYDNNKHAGKTIEWQNTKNTKKNPRLTDKNISVIINRNSASASEILASALKDRANANLVGEKSYGKGIGQVRIPRMGRDMLRITFMQIKGISKRTGDYHKKGIEPDPVPENIAEEVKILCGESNRELYDLCVAVRLLDKSASIEDIENVHEKIKASGTMKMKKNANDEWHAGAYIVTETDPLK